MSHALLKAAVVLVFATLVLCIAGCPGGTSTPRPKITVSETSHTFAQNENEWTFDVWNSGDADTTLTFSVTDNRNWITTSVTGTTSDNASDPQTVTVTIDRDAFAKATYTGTVTISATGISSVTVSLTASSTPATPIDTWQEVVGGTADDYAAAYELLDDGSLVFCGYTTSYGAGQIDMYFVKLNEDGSLAWQKTFGGSKAEEAVAFDRVGDSGYVIAGYTTSYGAGGSDAYIVRTNAAGVKTWAEAIGGDDNDVAKSIAATADGGFIVTGQTFSYGAGNADVFLVKLDSAGEVVWADVFGGAAADYGEWVRQTPDGGFLVGAYSYSFGDVTQDVYIIKTDDSGDLILSKGTAQDFRLYREESFGKTSLEAKDTP